MTKQEWISVLQHTLMKSDEQSRYRRPLLERHMSAVYEQFFSESYLAKKRGILKYTQDYTETLSGEADLTSGHTLTTLPVVLPRYGGGVFGVKTDSLDFILTDYNNVLNALNSNFDTANIKGKYLACIRGDKLYGTTTIANGETITYSLIPKFTSLSDTDEVLLPDGMEEHFIDRIIDTLQHVPATDFIHDNNISNG